MPTTVYDIAMDEDGDLYLDPITMDLAIIPSENQHIADILYAEPGHFKEFPYIGWGPLSRLNSKNSDQKNNQDAKVQLQSDGLVVDAIKINLDPDGIISLAELSVNRP